MMIYVYSQGDEFCCSTFNGSRDVALANGYKEITEAKYKKLLNHTAHWVDGELVNRTKTAEDIAEETKAEKLAEIETLKKSLSATDYKAIKFAEGWISADDYAETKAERQQYRERINQLESEVVQ